MAMSEGLKNALLKIWNYVRTNPKTSAAGVVGFIASMLAHYGVIFPESIQAQIIGLTVLVVSILASDGGKG